MKKQFIVRVEMPTCDPHKPFNKVYERQISFDGSLKFPYYSLLESLTFLYGESSRVSFIVH